MWIAFIFVPNHRFDYSGKLGNADENCDAMPPPLHQFGLRVAMSGKGNCFENAPMESFRGTFKQELVHHRHYASRWEAMQDITEYIEIFNNRQRLQPRLGFMSPATYTKRFYAGLLAA